VLRRQQRVRHVLSRASRIAAAAAAILLAGCGGGGEQSRTSDEDVVAHAVAPPPLAKRTPTATPTATARPSRTPAGRAAATGRILSAGDRASFRRLAASLGGEHGLAVSGIGPGQPVEQVGALESGAAWSTAKVPIVMAVIDAGQQSSLQRDLAGAITASDNAAATRLWASLGPPAEAAQAADAELRRSGDQHTLIESHPLRGAGYTPSGQSACTLRDQTRFTARLPFSAAGVQTLTLMGRVVAGQRWGLGAAGVPAQIKGGWGPGVQPGVAGGYLDRQLGILTIAGTPLAVAIASRPADGSHATGTQDLTAIARWLVEHADVDGLPTRPHC
jgi:hypothetical protein